MSLMSRFAQFCSTQRKRVEIVPMEKCKSRVTRCKLTPNCQTSEAERKGRLISAKDMICGTDANTYMSECELNHATCL